MTLRRPSALLLAAAFAALARPARADDAQTAAAAAQVLSQAGAAAPGAKKKDEGGFSRPLSAPKIEKTSGDDEKPVPAKKKAAVKAKPSKYRSRDLTEHSESVYRFNAEAEPLDSAPKKKAAAKPKKKTSSEPDEKAEKTGACSSDESCPAKNPVGDAF